jgi:hypothetical protein
MLFLSLDFEKRVKNEKSLSKLIKQLFISGSPDLIFSALKDVVPAGNTIFSVLKQVSNLISNNDGGS